MNLRDLGYLVAVADERHFGRAAEACHVGQPTLSTQIRKLEAELGVDLLERNPGQVLLTEAGEQVVERARVILHEADTIRELARRAIDPEAGTVRVGDAAGAGAGPPTPYRGSFRSDVTLPPAAARVVLCEPVR